MEMRRAIAAGLVAAGMLWGGSAMGQAKPACDPKVQPGSAAGTPEKVTGEVVKVDQATGRVTIKEADGKTYEFHANKDTLQTLKVGDRLEATLRTASAC
jgi:Cu/Ag efflux protein CusF